MPRTLIIVDNDVLATLEVSHTMVESGFAVLGQARNLATARKLLRVRLPAAALISAELPDGDSGLALARDLQACGVRVVLTSRGPVEGWEGPYLAKPFAPKSLVDLLTVGAIRRQSAEMPQPSGSTG
jgi:DNA-binding response OmpR family regulator